MSCSAWALRGKKKNRKEDDLWRVVQCEPVDRKRLKYLVRNGTPVNCVNEVGETVLYPVVRSRSVKVTKCLVKLGADVHCRNNDGRTVLHAAVQSYAHDVVKYLVKHGANVNCKDNDGRTVLLCAIESNSPDSVMYLLDHGADVNCKDNDSRTVLHRAVEFHSSIIIVKYLVQYGADVNCKDNDGKTVLHCAIESNSRDIFIIEELVKLGVDVNCKDNGGRTALHRAVESYSADIVKCLVELHGADVNYKDNDSRTALHSAVLSFKDLYSPDIIKSLIEDGADINCKDKDGRTVLHHAIEFHSPIIIFNCLIDHGPDVNCKDNNGRTVLHCAVESHSLDVVKYLVEHGADGNCKDAEGKSVLHTAVQYESLKVVKYLVEYCDAEVNCKDNYDKTVLQSAVDSESLDIVKCLVENGAHVNTEDKSTTDVNDLVIDILKMAVSKNSVNLVELLLEKGMDARKYREVLVEVPGGQMSLVELSIDHGYYDITDILKPELEKSVRHSEKIELLKKKNCNELNEIEVPIRAFVAKNEFKIGNGNATSVYVGVMKDGSEVAVKRIFTQSSEDVANNENKIVNLVDTTKSPFVVSYRHFCHDDTFMYFIIDLCEETLKEHVHSQPAEDLRKYGPQMIKEILTGLTFLHEKRILHRDLKPTNILVDIKGHMKLADFGISRVLNEDETTALTDVKGTDGWMPTEVVKAIKAGQKSRFKRKSDVQVTGMIAFFLLTKGEHPFGSSLNRMENILDGNPVNLKKLDDRSAQKFVSWLISHKIDKRPYAHEALTHPFVKESDIIPTNGN